MIVIGIGGGSGSGKTTVCQALAASYPDQFEVLGLDNYQKAMNDPTIPRVDGMINWDHPSVVLWEDLRRDVLALKRGSKVRTMTWTHRSVAGVKEPRTLLPKPVVIVEGYLALYTEAANIYDKKIYLQLDEDIRNVRRRQARGDDDVESIGEVYRAKILKPMHDLYVEPTKHTADIIIDVQGKSVDDVVRAIWDAVKVPS